MKWKLLLCLALFAVAGCASDQQDPYGAYRNLGFDSDMIPSPVEGLTAADVANVYGSTVVPSPSVYSRGN